MGQVSNTHGDVLGLSMRMPVMDIVVFESLPWMEMKYSGLGRSKACEDVLQG